MPRIAWVEEAEATGKIAELYESARERNNGRIPEILRTMSLRPDFFAAVYDASLLHFSDGALTQAQHEMIASYVSALNRCHY